MYCENLIVNYRKQNRIVFALWSSRKYSSSRFKMLSKCHLNLFQNHSMKLVSRKCHLLSRLGTISLLNFAARNLRKLNIKLVKDFHRALITTRAMKARLKRRHFTKTHWLRNPWSAFNRRTREFFSFSPEEKAKCLSQCLWLKTGMLYFFRLYKSARFCKTAQKQKKHNEKQKILQNHQILTS
jgi:hypothetical protein